MKKKLLYLNIILLLLLNLFTVLRLNKLEREINNNIQQISMIENNFGNQISNIYLNVDEKLKKQVSILDSYDVKFGSELNTDNLTVPITVTMTPKEYSDGLASSLQLNDKILEMQRDGTSFSVTTNASIFDDVNLKIILNQNGVQKTETIANDEYQDLKGKYILEIMNGGFAGQMSKNSGKYIYDGNINLHFNRFEENNPKSLTIIKKVNDKVIEEEKIDLSKVNLSYERPVEIPMKNTLDIGTGDKFVVYAEVVDKYDLTYKYIIINSEINGEGDPVSSASNNVWPYGVIEIRDKNGKVVYTPEYKEQ